MRFRNPVLIAIRAGRLADFRGSGPAPWTAGTDDADSRPPDPRIERSAARRSDDRSARARRGPCARTAETITALHADRRTVENLARPAASLAQRQATGLPHDQPSLWRRDGTSPW